MNENFENKTRHIIINDDGIIYHCTFLNMHIFFPYGSMTELKIGLLGLSIKGGTYSVTYKPIDNQKERLKQLFPTLQNLNARATKCAPIPLNKGNEKIEKSLESISAYFSEFRFLSFRSKNLEAWKENISNIVGSMDEDEEILHAFYGGLMHINGGCESIVNYIGLITNRRFYYVGCEGKTVRIYFKTGNVELKDIHSISTGVQTVTTYAYVQFEVRNDDYRLYLVNDNDINIIKQKLEEGIKACENKANMSAVPQMGISSADELKKFKELLDSGIITQEEFDAKKRQLLGL